MLHADELWACGIVTGSSPRGISRILKALTINFKE
ncbi:hypothetical protein Ab1vBOLIVR2_gp13 [Agrobacterium phage OLIVR2]|uniref:Uncharacterized protein n=1 Tax=Agrobacterium phage OLIVR1 TaxID=2723769 RepID=A0A858MRP2_9CAUD|nr:hypothetical protein KNU98_gp096 [Agrobacterium phage OLIVR1]QIW87208.1 hypothetical protein Ab1vBOLIVR1_gp13 [Agrobacterium phage OLIVR1]QIW87316.1 hypothetical protein Ab1vBOLIVR2_gp13 [Agrobacterium phage OLIVR2]